jgi:hypothetical protein
VAARAVLASAYYGTGKMASAVQLYERVQAQYTEVLGGSHRRTLAASLNLSHALYGVGRMTDAGKLLRETAERCQVHLPSGDPLTATAHESLRNVLGEAGVSDAGLAPQSPLTGTVAAGEADEFAGDLFKGGIGRRVTGRHRTIR